MKNKCIQCGRAYEMGISSKLCSESCAQIRRIVRKRGHR